MRKAYFHIGFGKTGSSSLQSYLSLNPQHFAALPDKKLIYCSVLQDGSLIYGQEVRSRAEKSPLQYIASAPAIAELNNFDKLKQNLDALFEAGYTPIFSQEDWGRRAGHFKNSNFFKTLDLEVELVVYVRPQVDWFNSAWWQWFAWEKDFTRPRDVIDAWGFNFMLWAEQIEKWSRLEGVSKTHVRLQPSNIVIDFLDIIDVPAPQDQICDIRNNVSLTPTLIRLLKSFPHLRSTHGADVDCILSKHLKFEGKTPWIVDKDLIESILNGTKQDNIKLSSMLDDESRTTMECDARWWDVEFYNNYRTYEEVDPHLSEEEMTSIIHQTIPALIRLSRTST